VKRVADAVATVYIVLMAIAVTYPGVLPFNTIPPYVLGLPFAFFWPAAWVAGATLVFYFVQRTHRS
jgi:hypothetical protein